MTTYVITPKAKQSKIIDNDDENQSSWRSIIVIRYIYTKTINRL